MYDCVNNIIVLVDDNFVDKNDEKQFSYSYESLVKICDIMNYYEKLGDRKEDLRRIKNEIK